MKNGDIYYVLWSVVESWSLWKMCFLTPKSKHRLGGAFGFAYILNTNRLDRSGPMWMWCGSTKLLKRDIHQKYSINLKCTQLHVNCSTQRTWSILNHYINGMKNFYGIEKYGKNRWETHFASAACWSPPLTLPTLQESLWLVKNHDFT